MSDNIKSTKDGGLDIDDNIEMLNVFLLYFKQLFNKEKNYHMFTEINYDEENSTTRPMELLYDHLYKYKLNHHNEEITAIYKPEHIDIDNCIELYVLNLNGEQKYACQFLIPLIKLLTKKQWLIIDWSIDPIKTDS